MDILIIFVTSSYFEQAYNLEHRIKAFFSHLYLKTKYWSLLLYTVLVIVHLKVTHTNTNDIHNSEERVDGVTYVHLLASEYDN